MNIITAFLTEDLDEKIYMKQSEEFEVEDEDENFIWLFEKSFYELKQVTRLWNQKIWRYLKSINFVQC